MLALVQDPILARIDRRLALIIGGSLVVHIGIAAYAWSADLPEDPTFSAAQPQLSYQEVIDIVVPDPVPAPVTAPAPVKNTQGIAAPVRPSQQVARPIVRPTITSSDHVDAQGLASLLTGNHDETRRSPELDLAKQIQETRENHWQVGAPGPTDESWRIGTNVTPPPADAPLLTHTTGQHQDEPRGHIIPGEIKPESSTTLTPSAVLQLIQSQYLSGLQRCYRLGLAADATLSGKVQISFTVTDHGGVTEADASGVSSSVDSCIDQQMGRWRFPVPKDPHGAPTDATYSVSLALQSS